MRKFSVYFACFFALVLMGCGDTSGDPTARITLEADQTEVTPGGSAVITATVTKAVGKKAEGTAEATVITEPGWGENVTFKLLTSNGGRLSISIQKTDGDGKARSVYTAGNNYDNDTIQAMLDNGMTAAIVMKKSGTLTGASISSFAASPATVAGGQSSVITAKVTDGGSSNPIRDEGVTFTVATNESGGCLLNASNACANSVRAFSDTGGNAVAVYRAGNNDSTAEVHDTVRGSLANGSTNAAIITRSAEPVTPVTPTTPLSIAVAASPASVTAGQVSIVTATLTGDDNVGVTVTFTLPVNNSGATLFASTARTDGSGKAVVIYQPGTTSPTSSVSDTVQATVGSISSIAVITRTGTATTAYTITVSAVPTTLGTDTSNSTITANVKDNLGTAVSGVTVTFTVTGPAICGSVLPLTSVTNGSGNAGTVFTGNGALVAGIPTRATGETDVVTASVTINGTIYTGNVVITYP